MLLKDDVVNMSKSSRSPRTALAIAVVVACLALAGCTQSPAKHDDRLTKAAGIARVTIVCSKDLWDETKPDGKNISNGPAVTVKATVSGISTGPRADRGLVEVSMTGTNLVAYLKELDANAHPSSWNGTPENGAASRRVYDAIAPRSTGSRPPQVRTTRSRRSSSTTQSPRRCSPGSADPGGLRPGLTDWGAGGTEPESVSL
ncbi:hypothetical protein [Streptomyces sp. NBC_01237]|uniref:hypothetical protein n=1 Tax=Streptomyces sp. NBC_01237 TaxID=2903790 RepID=UPI002DDAE54E|nr:hypothetical protein [Streptomyces sp. NBC_01237]WRZ76563.1 hypothetical protein OG251_35860 [Streptomyces sp. NBC_01237]